MVLIKQLKGYRNYKTTLLYMERKVNDLKNNKKKREEIWILEHKQTITAGSSSNNFNKKTMSKIPVVKVNRGGQLTYHGPGQLIIYFMINIKKRQIGIIEFIEMVENTMINIFKKKGIKLYQKKEKNRGLWMKTENGLKKIIFIGLRYSGGIVYHGMSINLNVDLQKFRLISPCGLKTNEISSLSEQKIEIDINTLKKNISDYLTVKFPQEVI